jgi:probable rRNA maturation factor
MILIDPDIEPDPAPKATSAKRRVAAGVPAAKDDLRLPSALTLARFLSKAQRAVRLKGQVTVLLTTDAAIAKLNRQFRGKNKATDVLSFPAEGLGAEGIAGDVAISVTTAMGQAREQGHSLSTEIKVLILHGLLHLAGYDHEADDGGKMARREGLLRGRLGLPQGLIERAGAAMPGTLNLGGKDRSLGTSALKGHGFSRAVKSPQKTPALAAEGMQVAKKPSPQGLKPNIPVAGVTARLKSCPFKAELRPFKTELRIPKVSNPRAKAARS